MKNHTTILSIICFVLFTVNVNAVTPLTVADIPSGDDEESVDKPIISIDWFITDDRQQLPGTKASLIMDGNVIEEIKATKDGRFNIQLYSSGVYKIVLNQDGYMEKEIILGFFSNDHTVMSTEVEVDLMSLQEFSKIPSHQSGNKVEILLYNDDKQLFEPGYISETILKERFDRLEKAKSKNKHFPTNKFKS